MIIAVRRRTRTHRIACSHPPSHAPSPKQPSRAPEAPIRGARRLARHREPPPGRRWHGAAAAVGARRCCCCWRPEMLLLAPRGVQRAACGVRWSRLLTGTHRRMMMRSRTVTSSESPFATERAVYYHKNAGEGPPRPPHAVLMCYCTP